MAHLIYLSLGSNLGRRRRFLRRALDALPPQVSLLRLSPLYETAPWGYLEQGDFLNLVVEAETDLQPRALLDHIKSIETRIGREAIFRYGPRQIDLDILFYNDRAILDGELVIPHPRLHERAFVLAPLADLAPNLRHPQLDKTVAELLSDIPNAGELARNIGDLYEDGKPAG